MSIEVIVASGEWAIVKSKKARRAPSISSGVMHTTDQGPLSPLKGKEPVKAPPNRKCPDVVIAGPTSMRGQRKSTSRTTGSSKVPPLTPPM
ncbi:hypothetical protein NC651_003814 [Populus alba x Populus x berolinensis]|nr:hypothetical protein NC651_003814 [Populus alba x Populus x berolinensis]